MYSSKPFKRRKAKSIVQAGKHVYPLVLDSDFPTSINGIQDKSDGMSPIGVPISLLFSPISSVFNPFKNCKNWLVYILFVVTKY